jgi:hypothetical protein
MFKTRLNIGYKKKSNFGYLILTILLSNLSICCINILKTLSYKWWDFEIKYDFNHVE